MTKRNNSTRLSDEQALLVAAAYPEFTPARIEHLLTALEKQIDWDLVLDLAAWHGLTPLLTRALQRHARDFVPEEINHKLTARDLTNTRWTIEASGELLRIVTQLREVGIDALPFKGPVQAVQVYGEVSLREFSDLDLLITPQQAWAAHEVMLSAGYRPEVEIGRTQLLLYMRSECDRVYVHPESGIHVEIHWALAPPYFGVNVPVAELFARPQTIELCGQSIRTVSREDLLLILCVNGAKEMWEKLEWLSALTVLLNERKLNWDLVNQLSNGSGLRRMVRIGVSLASDVFGAPVPEHLGRELADDTTTRALVDEAGAWLFAPHFQGLRRGQLNRFRLSARERRRDRIRYRWLRMVTPTHPDLAFTRLAPRFQFLYYALRPIRLIVQKLGRHEPPR